MGKVKWIGLEVCVPIGAGPRIFVLIGRTDMFPTWRTSGSSLYEEWYAYMTFKMEIRHSILLNKMVQELTGMIICVVILKDR